MTDTELKLLKSFPGSFIKKFKRRKKILKTTLYEYGDGIYSPPIEDRVRNKIHKFSELHEIISVKERWIPQKYLGKNCMGMDVYKSRECFVDIEYLD